MRKNKNQLKLFFWTYPIIASLLSFALNTNFFVSAMIFLGTPSLILSFSNKNLIKKSALFSAVFVIPLTIVVDYLTQTTGTWYTPFSIFSYRIFGYVTIDMILWGFLYVYFVVMYYEYFVNNKSKDKLYSQNFKYLIIGSLIMILIFLILLSLYPSLLDINYLYLKIGLILVILPISLALFRFRHLFIKFVKAGCYFFYFGIIYEITAVRLKQWTFPGTEFIGYVNIFGTVFPFEEFFFAVILLAVSVISFYELFDNKS